MSPLLKKTSSPIENNGSLSITGGGTLYSNSRLNDGYDIFNNLIWPNFKNKDKIQIIIDDAIGYLRRKHNNYDYIFADLWHSPDDGLPLFVEIKKIDKKIDCWLETSMYALLRRCMFTLLDEQLHGLKDNNYLKAKTYTDKVINKFYFQTKNLHLINEDDLDNLLDFNNLLNLVIGL